MSDRKTDKLPGATRGGPRQQTRKGRAPPRDGPDDGGLAARDSESPLDVLRELERTARERALIDTTPAQLHTLREQVELIFWARENDERIEHLHQMDLLAEETGRRVERQAAIGGWIVVARRALALVAFGAVALGGIALAYDEEQLGSLLRTLAW